MPTDKKPKKTTSAAAKKKTAASKKVVAAQAVVEEVKQTTLAEILPYEVKKGEEYMNPKQEKHFINILNAWKYDLMREVDRTKNHMQDEAANFPDPNDRASQEEGFSLELRTRDRERKLIKKIEETLERINNEDYGFCDACGIEIGIRRLEARPTASLCIDCKTLDEMKERAG